MPLAMLPRRLASTASYSRAIAWGTVGLAMPGTPLRFVGDDESHALGAAAAMMMMLIAAMAGRSCAGYAIP